MGVKKNSVFLLTLVGLFIFINSVFAQVVLPNPLGNTTTFTALFTNIGNYIASLVGGLAVIMFIWAGILYLTSGANPGNVQKANKTVLYAAIGLAIALAGAGLIALIQSVIIGP